MNKAVRSLFSAVNTDAAMMEEAFSDYALTKEQIAELTGCEQPADDSGECCLCGGPFAGLGHNAWPFGTAEHRCCNDCNEDTVIPARVELFFRDVAAGK